MMNASINFLLVIWSHVLLHSEYLAHVSVSVFMGTWILQLNCLWINTAYAFKGSLRKGTLVVGFFLQK